MQDLGTITPGLEEFRELAGHNRVIPVRLKVLADAETPIGLYRKLAQGQPGTFLMESAAVGGAWSRYSFIGARSRATLTTRDGQAFRMREYCNPFQTYKAFGKAHWESSVEAIMRDHNRPWPASQAPDPITLPET